MSAVIALQQLSAPPEAADAVQRVIDPLDQCFLYGFAGGQRDGLAALPVIFAGTPLEQRLKVCVVALMHSEFVEAHFVTLAAARASLQGTRYDLLRGQALAALDRNSEQPAFTVGSDIQPTQSNPLLDSARHWLMELAITGFSRLESGTVSSFAPTLLQLQIALPTLPLSALLTGFFHEIRATLPIKEADQVPLHRWCDLWSAAMLNAVGIPDAPVPSRVSGTLYPLGADMRQHSHAASLTVYSLLVCADAAQFVRHTWSAFKVAAIRGNECWLLFPEAQLLLQSLNQRKNLQVRDMPLLPSGDALWLPEWAKAGAKVGKKANPLDIAARYFASGATVLPAPPLERHPIQIAEPTTLSECSIQDDMIRLTDGSAIPLDTRRNTLPADVLTAATTLFGLLRYDAGRWLIQPLIAADADGKMTFAGQDGIELSSKPPKTSTVSILSERASRLLRR